MNDLVESAAPLVVTIGADAMTVSELASLLTAFDGSFSRFARSRLGRGSKPRLIVRAVKPGSIEVLLEAIDGARKVLAAKEFLAPWVTHVSELLQWTLRETPIARREDRKLVEAIAHPIANGSATQINVIHHGDVVIHVGASEAAAIVQALQAPRLTPGPAERSEAPPQVRLMDDDQIFRLHRGELIGTAFDVAGEWYARLEGLRGVLVPIHAGSDVISTLADGQGYRFTGRTESGPRGETIAIALTEASPI